MSVVEGKCDKASNNVKVTYNKPAKEKDMFAVCVKGLSILDDVSARLTEWLELLLAVGADRIFLYTLELHVNVSKVGRKCFIVL